MEKERERTGRRETGQEEKGGRGDLVSASSPLHCLMGILVQFSYWCEHTNWP